MEAARLTAVFRLLLAIHHTGSTAVPGILAKPTLDTMIEVRDIGQVEGYNQAMAALGARHLERVKAIAYDEFLQHPSAFFIDTGFD